MANYRFTFDAVSTKGWDIKMFEDWLHEMFRKHGGQHDSPIVPGSVKAEVLSEDD